MRSTVNSGLMGRAPGGDAGTLAHGADFGRVSQRTIMCWYRRLIGPENLCRNAL